MPPLFLGTGFLPICVLVATNPRSLVVVSSNYWIAPRRYIFASPLHYCVGGNRWQFANGVLIEGVPSSPAKKINHDQVKNAILKP